jgi:hypothetical protein
MTPCHERRPASRSGDIDATRNAACVSTAVGEKLRRDPEVLAKARERVRVGGATAPPGRTAGRAAEVDPARDPHLLLQSVTGGAYGKEWVPALGYLDKVEGLLQKAVAGQLTNAEVLILQNQDLALLSRYEQARDLTVTLLKKWLVEYKFRDWTKHATDPTKKGNPVTSEEKQERAEQIARMLGDNKRWHSHNRMIGPDTLTQELKLQINDYSGDDVLRPLVRSYNDLLTDYIARNGWVFFMHNRDFF